MLARSDLETEPRGDVCQRSRWRRASSHELDFTEVPLEARRGNDLEQARRIVPGVPERVPPPSA